MRFGVLVFSGLCLSLVVAGSERDVINRKRRSSTSLDDDNTGDDVGNCTHGCLNSLRSSTEADDAFRPHFLELSALSSVVPQVFLSNVDLDTFKNYCRFVYTPFRECLWSCSNEFTADVIRNLTMLETMCVDYYQEMTLHAPCMKQAYKTASSSCESTCFPTNILPSTAGQPPNETPADTTAAADPAVEGISVTPISPDFIDAGDNGSSPSAEHTMTIQRDDPHVYLKPNETVAFFCWLLKCVSICDTVQVQKQCGYEAADLEDVLVDAMARTTMSATQSDQQSNMWPGVCDKLMLRHYDNGQEAVSRTRSVVLTWISSTMLVLFLTLRTY